MIFSSYVFVLILVISSLNAQSDCPFPTCDYGIENNICTITCYLSSPDYTLEYGDPIYKKIDKITLDGAYNIPDNVFRDLDINECEIILSTENQINVSRNAFANVKSLNFLSFSMLKNLDLFNQIDLTYIKNLTTFKIDKYALTEEIETIDVKTITSLLETVKNFKSLKEFYLIESKVGNINFQLSSMKNLNKIDLTNNLINQASLTSGSVTQLILEQNKISSVDRDWFKNLANLNLLNLAKNSLSKISKETFKDLLKLEILDLSENSIVEFDEHTFVKGNKLKSLDLTSNKLEDISFLEENIFDSLKYLKASSNLIDKNDFSKFNLPNLESLIMENNLLKSLDSKFFSGMKQLKEINLGFNQIEKLDAFKETSGNLIKLILTNNKIINTEFLGNLKSLEYLDLSFNLIESFGEYLVSNINLKELYLQNNKISKLTLSRLGSLEILDLSNNQIESIEQSVFAGLTSLNTLRLNDNKLFYIEAKSFKFNTKLAILDLSNNYLSTIPSIWTLSNLTDFKMTNQNGKLKIISNNAFEIENRLSETLTLDLISNNITKFQPKVFCSQFNDKSVVDNMYIKFDSINQMDKCSLKQLANSFSQILVNNDLNCDLKYISDSNSITVFDSGLLDCSSYKFTDDCGQPSKKKFDCTQKDTDYFSYILYNSEIYSYKFGKQTCEFLGEKLCFANDKIEIYCTNSLFQNKEMNLNGTCVNSFRLIYKNDKDTFVYNVDLENFPDSFDKGNKIIFSRINNDKLFELKVYSNDFKVFYDYENSATIYFKKYFSKLYALAIKGNQKFYSQAHGLLYDSSSLECLNY